MDRSRLSNTSLRDGGIWEGLDGETKNTLSVEETGLKT
jgi:hypothetical protein